MNEDKAWERIVDAIDTKYGLIKFGKTERQITDAPNLTEKIAYIIFDRGPERYKLERVAGPAIIDRKTIGSKRIGSDVRFENTYDPHETSYRTNLYHEVGDSWMAISPEILGL
jgi:hypothetical protein